MSMSVYCYAFARNHSYERYSPLSITKNGGPIFELPCSIASISYQKLTDLAMEDSARLSYLDIDWSNISAEERIEKVNLSAEVILSKEEHAARTECNALQYIRQNFFVSKKVLVGKIRELENRIRLLRTSLFAYTFSGRPLPTEAVLLDDDDDFSFENPFDEVQYQRSCLTETERSLQLLTRLDYTLDFMLEAADRSRLSCDVSEYTDDVILAFSASY